MLLAIAPLQLFASFAGGESAGFTVQSNASSETNSALLDEIRREREVNQGLIGFNGEYALTDDSGQVGVIVLFENSPAAVQVILAEADGISLSMNQAEALVENEHDSFMRDLNALFVAASGAQGSGGASSYIIQEEFYNALNGVSIVLPANMVEALLDFESVRAILPDEVFDVEFEEFTEEDLDALASVTLPSNPAGNQGGRMMLEADNMHALGYKGQGVVVAVIDTGIDYAHPAVHNAFMTWEEVQAHNERRGANIQFSDLHYVRWVGANAAGTRFWSAFEPIPVNKDLFLGRNVMQGWWTAEIQGDYPPNYPMESIQNLLPPGNTATTAGSNHGSHVSGTILSRDMYETRGTKSLGVAPEAKLIMYRALGVAGTNGHGTGSVTTILRAIEWTAKDKPDVVNMSLGGGSQTTNALSAIGINNVMLADPYITYCVSAGNGGSGYYTATDPAPSSMAITVANLAAPSAILPRVNLQYGATVASASIMYTRTGTYWDVSDGYVRSTYAPFPTGGNYRIYAMPRTPSNNLIADVPADGPGSGTVEDFAALRDLYTNEELAGAFVLVARGSTFVDVSSRAISAGLAGVVGIVRPAETTLPAHSTAVEIPFLYMHYAAGRALHTAIVAAGGELNFSLPGRVYYDYTTSVASSSSRGPIYNSQEIKPDIGAHGSAVTSSTTRTATSGYASMTGTSMASPHMAGAVALLVNYSRENGGQWTNQEIKSRLMNNAMQLNQTAAATSVFTQGSGSANAYKAAMADTVVSVAYDRVLRSPLAVNVDMETMPPEFYATMQVGSFSFGGFNKRYVDRGVNRTLTATIENNSAETRTYEISSAWAPTTVTNARNPATNGASLSFSANSVTVAAGGSETFTATMVIPPAAQDGHYEGIITVRADGAAVATIPFGGVAATNLPNFDNVRFYRPVISTGAKAQNVTSRELGVLFTPRKGLALRSWVYDAAAIGEGLNERNWSEAKFDDYFVGFAGTFEIPRSGATYHYTAGSVHRAVIFNGKVLDLNSIPEEQRIAKSGVLNGGPGPLNYVTQSQGTWFDLDEGDYILVTEVHESEYINDWIWNYDTLFEFAVDNTVPEVNDLSIAGILTDTLIGNKVPIVDTTANFVVSGNVFDEFVDKAAAAGTTFDIWTTRRPASALNNLAVFVQVGTRTPVRVDLDAAGGFQLTVNPTGLTFPVDVRIYAIDNYSVIPITDKLAKDFPPIPMSQPNVNWPLRALTGSTTFNAATGGYITAGTATDNLTYRAARLPGQPASTAAVINQHLWTGLNMETLTYTLVKADTATKATVSAPALTSITRGNSVDVTYNILPDDSSVINVVWASSNHDVATISPTGRITAHKVGNAVITLTVNTVYGPLTATFMVRVG